MRARRIAIVGAGLGGLTAAQAIRRAGCEVVLIEQSPTLSEIGAGINLSPNAVKVLADLDMADEIKRRGFESLFHIFRDWRSGRHLFRLRTAGVYERMFGAPHLSVHRADLHETLRRGISDSMVRLGARCVGAVNSSQGAMLRLENGEEIEADIVVGADGIHSVVREAMFGKADPLFTGCVAWRFTVQSDQLSHQIEPGVSNWMGPGGHVVHYYVRGGDLVNVVAVFETEKWTEESWVQKGDKEELLRVYAGWNSELTAVLEKAETCYMWGIFDRDPLPYWSSGHMTLLGDSAHPMLPFMGQGAAMAMEDGLLLGLLFEKFDGSSAELLKTYERLRLPRTARVQLGSRGRATENHLRSPMARFRRNLNFRWRQLMNPYATLHKADWVYAYHPRSALADHEARETTVAAAT